MSLTLAVYNLKGGVGKTATAVNLSYLAAREGFRTLLWDLDPQGAASFYLRVDSESLDDPELWLKPKFFHERIFGSDYLNLDIISSNLSLRHIDVELAQRKHSSDRLKRLLRALPEEYDLIVLDCAPSLSFVSDNIFELADYMLVPTIPTHLSIRAYEQIVGYMKRPDQAIPFFSMVDRRRRLHRDLIGDFARRHEELIRRYVPYSSDIEKMGAHRAPVHEYAASSPGARAYFSLWQAVKERLDIEALLTT